MDHKAIGFSLLPLKECKTDHSMSDHHVLALYVRIYICVPLLTSWGSPVLPIVPVVYHIICTYIRTYTCVHVYVQHVRMLWYWYIQYVFADMYCMYVRICM